MATTKTIAGSGYGNPFIDGLIRGGYVWNENSGPIKVYLAGGADTLGNHQLDAGVTVDGAFLGWNASEMASVAHALQLYSSVSGVSLQLVTSKADADIVLAKNTSINYTDEFGTVYTLDSYQEPPRQNGPIWGFFNPNAEGWEEQAHGGDGRFTILHELGHALGLHHVRDDDEFPRDYSLFTYNQGIYTLMTSGVLGGLPETGSEGGFHDLTFGAQGGLGAFDIAALQAIYGGANMSARPGNDVYTLPTTQGRGTGWMTIWDGGGIDMIDASNSVVSVNINLSPATLVPAIPEQGGKNAGGLYSAQVDISGGFTIAAGVVIENARGGQNGDVIHGNAYGNAIWGGGGKDQLFGEEGNDVLYGEANDDLIYAGSGDDTVWAGDFDDIVRAAEGNDYVSGDDGDDFIYGAAGNDAIYGGNGQDHLYSEDGNDLVKGESSRDTIEAGTGNDTVYGGSDNDYIYAQEGNDRVYGDDDVDSLHGDSGNDTLYGGAGADSILGDAGNDILYGGAYRDIYTGGTGKDTFVLDSKPSRSALADSFPDFNTRDDTIQLSKSYFKFQKAGKMKKDFFHVGGQAHDGDDRIIYNKSKGYLYYDADGTGGKAAILIVQMKVKGTLTYNDFIIG